MSEATARRRYKALCRERDALQSKGREDEHICEEISKILDQFPQLAEVNTEVSKAVASMLAAGEAISAANDTMMADGIGDGTLNNAQNPVSQTEKRNDAKEGEASSSSSGSDVDVSSAQKEAQNRLENLQRAIEQNKRLPRHQQQRTGHPRKADDKKKKPQQGGLAIPPWLNHLLFGTSLILRIYNDVFNAKPSFGAVNHMKCLSGGILCAFIHCFALDPCSALGRMCDPIVIAFGAHIHFAMTIGRSVYIEKSDRSIFERIFVYFVRDLIPSLVSVFVVYMLSMVVFSMLFGVFPDVIFCFD